MQLYINAFGSELFLSGTVPGSLMTCNYIQCTMSCQNPRYTDYGLPALQKAVCVTTVACYVHVHVCIHACASAVFA